MPFERAEKPRDTVKKTREKISLETKEVDIAQKSGAGKFIMKPYILEKIGLAIKEELD